MKEILVLLGVGFLCASLQAREVQNLPQKEKKTNRASRRINALQAGCEPASQSADLDINNVRTRIMNGGDMWWDIGARTARYEVPKVNDANVVSKHSLFAGALWIGGLEEGSNNLKMAAMTYRTSGSDFWPGPLDVNTVNTEASRCESYDRIWKVTREEIERAEESGWQDISSNILEWPAGTNRGYSGISSANEASGMAPYFENPNGVKDVYEPNIGEYPVLYDDKLPIENTPSDQPDMMLWYVYNDNGNIHGETGGIPIGIEIQTQAFAFATNDEVNNMTFYRSSITNRGRTVLKQTYMGQWVDPDLGNPTDDYVGCDVSRALGICYNGDDNDQGIQGYGLNPPTIGIDYFEGPEDENGNELGLSHFVYYNNDRDPIIGDPRRAIDYYNFLQGNWKNGVSIKWGGNGLQGNTETSWMFPFDRDENGQFTTTPKWTEQTAGNSPGDRRFVQSSGPFTLKPGVTNHITVGAVWARATSGGALGSLELLRKASDKAQKLFNNQFDLVDGPNAPEVAIQELDQEVILTLLNTNTNRVEGYSEKVLNENKDTLEYEFQGYRVFQLKDATVGTGDLNNIDKAREIFQCDIEDDFDQVINQEFDATVSASIPVEKVNGENIGLVNTVSLKEDRFSTASNKQLVNFKTYYYMVLSYAVITNDEKQLDPNQYLAGRNNIQVYKAIPHKNEPEKTGIALNADYGSGPKIKTISGKGNGGNHLEFSPETIESILAAGSALEPVYLGGNGPVQIKITDPVKVPNANFRLEILDTVPSLNNTSEDSIRTQSTYWKLTNLDNSEVVYSDRFLNEDYESVQGKATLNGSTKPSPNLFDWGMSIKVNQVRPMVYDTMGDNARMMNWEVIWEDEGKQWLTALPDNDISPLFNWIRSGKTEDNSSTPYNEGDALFTVPDAVNPIFRDPFGNFEDIWGGRIAPGALVANQEYIPNGSRGTTPYYYPAPPAYNGFVNFKRQLNELASVDFIITRDKSKWTECVVFETGESKDLNGGTFYNIGGAEKFDMRKSPSKDRNGNEIPGSVGKSWFPGYAINIETGERLNIAFGEDSGLPNTNGSDMIWNPTSQMFNASNPYPEFGGKHYIYIMGAYHTQISGFKGSSYDRGNQYHNNLLNYTQGDQEVQNIYRQIMWVIPSLIAPGFEMGKDGMPPTDVTFKLRVPKPYATKEDKRLPVYEFNTNEIVASATNETTKNALDLINVVPNPYYAFSEYEGSPVDNRIKITNLPVKCTVQIFSTSGILVKTFYKDDDATYLDWNLKNNSNVPISGGVYIIHVKVPGAGERTLKWFGVMRSLDLDSY